MSSNSVTGTATSLPWLPSPEGSSQRPLSETACNRRSLLRQLRGAVQQLRIQPAAQLLDLVDCLLHLEGLD